MKLSQKALLALAISSTTVMAHAETQSQDFVPTSLSSTNAQEQTKGFFEEQSVSGLTRNWYANEQLKRGGKFHYNDNGVLTPTDRRINWLQGTIVKYNSGFSEGTVGVSTEVAMYNVVALERDTERLASANGGAPIPTVGGLGNNRTLTKKRRRRAGPVEQTRPGQRQVPRVEHHPDRWPAELQHTDRRCDAQPCAAIELRGREHP